MCGQGDCGICETRPFSLCLEPFGYISEGTCRALLNKSHKLFCIDVKCKNTFWNSNLDKFSLRHNFSKFNIRLIEFSVFTFTNKDSYDTNKWYLQWWNLLIEHVRKIMRKTFCVLIWWWSLMKHTGKWKKNSKYDILQNQKHIINTWYILIS